MQRQVFYTSVSNRLSTFNLKLRNPSTAIHLIARL